ncbi:3-phosphoshikimate 1-carboxyvinyltransferase [Gammaproteobacteria bacterium]|nr:3-phosphoshikimate 1-carboxyvinyltransferase [Gammaproteobacteria bacterium]
MYLTVKKTSLLSGTVIPPGSKSHTVRSVIFSLLFDGESRVENYLESEDTTFTINACQNLGLIIEKNLDSLILNSKGLRLEENNNEINTGDSGITTNFIMPILGLRKNYNKEIILNCNNQMRNRPIKPLIEALSKLGLNITHLNNDDKLPVKVKGKLVGGVIELCGSTSQYLSALLISLPLATENSQITVKNLNERPYIDMTLKYLENSGVHVSCSHDNNIDTFNITGNQQYKNKRFNIVGDFSSASSLIAAAVLIPGKVFINNLNMSDTQGDKAIIDILKKMGANITINKNNICIIGGQCLNGIKIDANYFPDLLPILSVIGACAQNKTEIYNVKHARYKETNRIKSMYCGLKKLGANIFEKNDGLIVYKSQLIGNKVNSFDDHRTFMALSIAGLLADGKTKISNISCINKTYPNFINDMKKIGANIEVI